MSSILHLPLRVPLLLLAVAALSLASLGFGPAHAQTSAVDAATLDLAARDDVDPETIDLTRVEAVTWNDACLGAAEADELCAQVLTDGWVVWLASGDAVSRYHTDIDGASLRLAASGLTLDEAAVAELPEGATPRDLPVDEGEEPVLILQPGVGTVSEFLTALEAEGLPAALQEIGILRPEIGVVSAGQISTDGTTIELYDLGSTQDADLLRESLRDDGTVLSANVTYWVTGQIAVVLNEAPSHPTLESTLNSILGSPVLLTISGGLPPAELPVDDTTPEILPNTGSGGVADPGAGFAAWLWVAVSGGFVVLVVTGLRFWSGRTAR